MLKFLSRAARFFKFLFKQPFRLTYQKLFPVFYISVTVGKVVVFCSINSCSSTKWAFWTKNIFGIPIPCLLYRSCTNDMICRCMWLFNPFLCCRFATGYWYQCVLLPPCLPCGMSSHQPLGKQFLCLLCPTMLDSCFTTSYRLSYLLFIALC